MQGLDTTKEQMSAIELEARRLVSEMTPEEKASLLSGDDYWHTKAVKRLGLKGIMLADGPHGLRKQNEGNDSVGIAPSAQATCFPTACATGSSFDTELLAQIGQAIGEEALDQGVSVVLGPGVNIKRSPLCGRNFEYFSEDPYLSGKLATAWIEGVQGVGVGASIKHFAANNQEYCRMVSDSIIDERTLREIYLSAFEIAVKQARPWTLMCSYNLVNGVYASENRRLLTDILRDEWGFEGLVVSDWGAVNSRVAGVNAGLDLEMPYSGGHNDALILTAIKEGQLEPAKVDEACRRVVALVLKGLASLKPGFECDYIAHHELARRAAAESCVLLKNDGALLPLDATRSVAVIGAFAKEPRYQGTGSSKVNPRQLDCALSQLEALGLDVSYEPGYSLARFAPPDEELMAAAVRLAEEKDVALVFAGLPDELESEGFDRRSLAMAQAHNALIEAVAAANPNTIVILSLGAPVETPWADKVAGILVSYLSGEAGGAGVADVLLGRVCPSGKLTETWPRALEDTPAYPWYPRGGDSSGTLSGTGKNAEYREGLYVGYRYYDTAAVEPAWPFGFGLSYTSFAYDDLGLSTEDYCGGELTVSFTLTNTGACAGAEVAQLYVGYELEGDKKPAVFRLQKELRGFVKVFLKPGESRRVEMKLDERAFAYYNAPCHTWAREAGSYRVSIGASSRDIRLSKALSVAGDGLKDALSGFMEQAAAYYDLCATSTLDIPDEQFEALLGHPLPRKADGKREYDQNTILGDVRHKLIGRVIIGQMRTRINRMLEGQDMAGMMDSVVYETPLRSLMMMSGGAFSASSMNAIIDLLNNRYLSGIRGLLRK